MRQKPFADKIDELTLKDEEKYQYEFKLDWAHSYYTAFVRDKYKSSFDVCDPIIDEFMSMIWGWHESIDENEEEYTDAKLRLYGESDDQDLPYEKWSRKVDRVYQKQVKEGKIP